jgi:hypothetical protein
LEVVFYFASVEEGEAIEPILRRFRGEESLRPSPRTNLWSLWMGKSLKHREGGNA